MQTSDFYKIGFLFALKKFGMTQSERSLMRENVGMSGGMGWRPTIPDSPPGTPSQQPSMPTHEPRLQTPTQATDTITSTPQQILSEKSPQSYN